MNATKSHTRTLTDEAYEQFRDKFDALVRNEIRIWLEFHKYWLEADIPVLVVRFEDLIKDANRQLTRMLEFSLGVNELSNYWKERRSHALETTVDRLGSYKPRPGPKDASGKGQIRFSPEQLQFIQQTADSFGDQNYLKLFGYEGLSLDDSYQLPDLLKKPESSTTPKSLRVNEGGLIRPLSCDFGRGLTAWRHSVTNKDEVPLPTVPR